MKLKFIYSLLLIITYFSIISCERDDICIDDITPHLTIRFYDNEDQSVLKKIRQLSIKIVGVENDSLNFSVSDSIFIPLIVTEDVTQYVLTLDSDENTFNRDTVRVNYDREDVFVGRACGFKTIFKNAEYTLISDDDNWIFDIETITQTIDNETKAHVKIFH